MSHLGCRNFTVLCMSTLSPIFHVNKQWERDLQSPCQINPLLAPINGFSVPLGEIPVPPMACEVSTVSTNPTLVLTTLFLCFRHTSFSVTQTCHHLVCSFKDGFCCVDQASPELVILLTPLPKYYLFFLKLLFIAVEAEVSLLHIGSCCDSPHVEAREKLCRVSSFCLYEGFRDGTHCQASLARVLSTKPSHQTCLLFSNSRRKICSYSLKKSMKKQNKQTKNPTTLDLCL